MRRIPQVASLVLALILATIAPAWATINVKTDYGAECDASDSDSTELQNALNAAATGSGNAKAGEAVLVPGNCTLRLDTTVTVPNGVRLMGENWSTSIITRGANVTALDSNDAVNVTIENLAFDGNGYSSYMIVYGVGNPANCTPGGFTRNYSRIRDVRMWGMPRNTSGDSYILVDDNACQVVLERVATTEGVYGVRAHSANSPVYIRDSVFYNQGAAGLLASGAGYGFLLYDSFILGDAVGGALTPYSIRMQEGTFQLHVRGSYLENMSTYGIYLEGDFTDLKAQDNYGLGTIHFGPGEHNDVTIEGNTVGSSPVNVHASATFPSPYAYAWSGNIYTGTVPAATGASSIPAQFVVSGNSHNQVGQQNVTWGAGYGTTKNISANSTWQTVATATFSHVHRGSIKFQANLYCWEQAGGTTIGSLRLRAGALLAETDVGLNASLSPVDTGFVTQIVFTPNALAWNGGDLSVIVEANVTSGAGITCNDSGVHAALIAIRPD